MSLTLLISLIKSATKINPDTLGGEKLNTKSADRVLINKCPPGIQPARLLVSIDLCAHM